MSADQIRSEGRDGSPAGRRCDPSDTAVAEHERQFREILEHCPAALIVVDEDGRLLFHNARLRELLGYRKDELDLIDTRVFWHDLEQRARIVEALRQGGGQLLNEEVVYRTKESQLIHVLMSYVQVAYRGGHVSFVGGKRICWVYDITPLKSRESQLAEHERQFAGPTYHFPRLVPLDPSAPLTEAWPSRNGPRCELWLPRGATEPPWRLLAEISHTGPSRGSTASKEPRS
jgi:PAS domain S-box-containing protein